MIAQDKKNEESMIQLITPFKPQLPISQLIVEVNKTFHNFVAKYYDKNHKEITEQLPPVWSSLIHKVSDLPMEKKWTILDYGCGTGFEIGQILDHIPHEQITEIVCYDLSVEMLEICRSKVGHLFPNIIFLSDISELSSEKSFNLLLTNSILHHLPNPFESINILLPLLSNDAFWISGHEPSSRYYLNQKCVDLYNQYVHSNKIKRYITPSKYLRKLRQIIQPKSNVYVKTAHELKNRGVFLKTPTSKVIGRLVDYFVAHSIDEALSGRGFDFKVLKEELTPTWSLDDIMTYSYMGSTYEGHLPSAWKHKCDALAEAFPMDGANFSAIWKRQPSN